ncbi:hypothetical protein ACYULU_15820 [Breznakiellaceae bacterium SP9]
MKGQKFRAAALFTLLGEYQSSGWVSGDTAAAIDKQIGAKIVIIGTTWQRKGSNHADM